MKNSEAVFVLILRAHLFGSLMARNALKSNVTWSSYPFIPPTGASGCLAEIVDGQRWFEGNGLGLPARRLHEVPGFEDVFALGAYPVEWKFSRRHFRSHLGSIFNYESYVCFIAQNEGKKLAVTEEVFADELDFIVASETAENLVQLHEKVRGRLSPVAKKGCLVFEYSAQAHTLALQNAVSTGDEETLALISMREMGSLPKQPFMPGQTLVHWVPLRSRENKGGIEWDVVPSIWDSRMKFRQGVELFRGSYSGSTVGISAEIWYRLKESWN